MAAAILPGGGVVFESGEITTYYRVDRDGRLLMGGRGLQHRATGRADYDHLVRTALRLWPALAGVSWTHWWNGQFALTPDFYPRLHMPERNLLIAPGIQWSRVAWPRRRARNWPPPAGHGARRPGTARPRQSKVPFHWLWRVAVTARVAYGTWRDHWEPGLNGRRSA